MGLAGTWLEVWGFSESKKAAEHSRICVSYHFEIVSWTLPDSLGFSGIPRFPLPEGILSLALHGEMPHLASCILGAAFTLLTVRRPKFWLCTSARRKELERHGKSQGWMKKSNQRLPRNFGQLKFAAFMLNDSTQFVLRSFCEHLWAFKNAVKNPMSPWTALSDYSMSCFFAQHALG